MNQDRFRKIQELFGRACSLSGAERARFLEQECSGDAELRSEVDDLLELDQGGDVGLQARVASRVGEAFSEEPALPRRIGHYEILDVVGRGGMGIVYRARQQNPDRIVALKVLPPSLFSALMRKRFEVEKQALARLQHSCIAQIFEAGTTDQGEGVQPWFAMEFIDGEQLLVWAEHRSIAEKLELLVDVCAAVQHANARGVIHRDLKPDNILVTAAGQPKVLDFGVARVTDSDVQLTTAHSGMMNLVGTLPYMSPEQVAGSPDELGPRSDVYSLGVLLFELLSSSLPYQLNGKQALEAARVIFVVEPTRLSSVAPDLRGDLETITSKALEKEPARRYGSAGELAADLERFLGNEPIHARPPSATYVLKKLARRNRGLFTGIAVALLVLIIAVIGLTSATVNAKRAEGRAKRQVEVTQRVNDYLKRILSSNDTFQGGTRETRIFDVLEAVSAEIDTVFADMPDQEAAIRLMLGTALSNMDEPSRADEELKRAIELFAGIEGTERRVIDARLQLGMVMGALDRSQEEQLQHFETLFADAKRDIGLRDELTLDISRFACFANSNTGNSARAAEILEEVIDVGRELLGPESSVYMGMLEQRAVQCALAGELQEARARFQEIVDMRVRQFGADHPNSLIAKSNLAKCLEMEGEKDAALHHRYMTLLRDLGRVDEALSTGAELMEALEGKRESSVLFQAKWTYADLLHEAGRSEEAESLCRDALGGLQAAKDRYACRELLAKILRACGRAEQASEELTGLLDEMTAEGVPESDERLSRLRSVVESSQPEDGLGPQR